MTFKQRIIASSLIATVALSALSLSITLAWYAGSDRLNVSAFEIQIVASHNLLISTVKDDREQYHEELDNDDLNHVDLFVPASSMHKNLWMDQKSDTPLFYDNSFYNVPPTGIPQIKQVTRGYFQQKFYLLSDITYNVTISVDESKFEADLEKNHERALKLYKENQKFTVEEYEEKLNNLAKSLRLSILIPDEENYAYYIVDPYKEKDETTNEEIKTVFAGRLDNDNDGYYDTYQYLEHGEFYEKETVYGEVLDRSLLVYDEPTDEPVVELEEVDHFSGNSFNGVSKGSAYAYNEEKTFEGKEVGDIYAIEESLSLEHIASADNTLLIPCSAGIPREIVMSVYLEGWDLDCVNATMGASFIDTISFKLAKGGIE